MEGFEYCDLVSHLRQLRRTREPGRSGPDDRDFLRALQADHRGGEQVVLHLVIGDEPLKLADCDRAQLLPHHAEGLALGFLGADPSADRGEIVCLPYLSHGSDIVLLNHQVDESPDVDSDGTPVRAVWLLAFKAALALLDRTFLVEAVRHFEEVDAPLVRRLFDGLLAGDLHPLRRLQGVVRAHEAASWLAPVSLQTCFRSEIFSMSMYVRFLIISSSKSTL